MVEYEDTDFHWESLTETLKGNMGLILTKQELLDLPISLAGSTETNGTVWPCYVFSNLDIVWNPIKQEPVFIFNTFQHKLMWINKKYLRKRGASFKQTVRYTTKRNKEFGASGNIKTKHQKRMRKFKTKK